MRWGAEFWMRVGIALFFFGLVVAAPMILFPFTVSLVLAILLNPLAKFIHEHIRVCRGMAKMPYDIAILISFAIFVGILTVDAISYGIEREYAVCNADAVFTI